MVKNMCTYYSQITLGGLEHKPTPFRATIPTGLFFSFSFEIRILCLACLGILVGRRILFLGAGRGF